MKPMEVAGWRVVSLGTERVVAQDVGGKRGAAEAHIFVARREDAGMLEIGHLAFGRSSDVRCLRYSSDTPEVLHRLTHGLRMSIQEVDGGAKGWVELRQARIKPGATPIWSNLYGATEDELDEGAGVSVRECLEALGGRMGTRASLLSDDGRKRHALCVLFDRGNLAVPMAAYLLTRVAPLLAGVEAG